MPPLPLSRQERWPRLNQTRWSVSDTGTCSHLHCWQWHPPSWLQCQNRPVCFQNTLCSSDSRHSNQRAETPEAIGAFSHVNKYSLLKPTWHETNIKHGGQRWLDKGDWFINTVRLGARPRRRLSTTETFPFARPPGDGTLRLHSGGGPQKRVEIRLLCWVQRYTH